MSSVSELRSNSFLFGSNAPYVEELYESYLDHPGSVPDQWRDYFDQLQHASAVNGSEVTRDQAHAPIIESFAQRAKANAFVARANVPDRSEEHTSELQSLMRISYAVFCLKKKKQKP